MFTGIIEEIGSIYRVQTLGGGIQLVVKAPRSSKQLKVNDSVSVNGVCQTVIARDDGSFTVVAVEETLAKTTLRDLRQNDMVNIELAMRLGDRLGGHLVAGHVDTVGVIESIEKRETSWFFRFTIPSQFRRYVIPVGSIAIDGVSLTVAMLEEDIVAVSVIPHTMENTIFSAYSVRERVNLEFDMIGKFIERLMGSTGAPTNEPISPEQLKNWGYEV